MSNRRNQCRWNYYIDDQEGVVYIAIKSAITALGFPAIVRTHFPGLTGKIASDEYIETLREMHEKLKEEESK